MLNKTKILVVDDDKHISEVVKLYLEKEGYEVYVAEDGAEGVNKFKAVQPKLVVLDIMLPVMDGMQVCNEIRRIDNTPIIMLSAKGEVFDKVLLLELGADDYMVKPFEPKELIARIKAILRRSAQREEVSENVEYKELLINITDYVRVVITLNVVFKQAAAFSKRRYIVSAYFVKKNILWHKFLCGVRLAVRLNLYFCVKKGVFSC